MKKSLLGFIFCLLLLTCSVDAKELIKKEIKFDSVTGTAFEEVLVTDDGGYVAVGFAQSDALIAKYDINDKLEWYKTFGGNSKDGFFDVEVTEDGGYLAVGVTESTNIEGTVSYGYSDSLVVKFDSEGNVLYKNIYGGTDRDYFSDIEFLENGDYIIVGSKGIKGYVSKFSSKNEIIWEKVVTGSSEFNGFTVDKKGNIIAVGYLNSNQSIVFKFSKDGEKIWNDIYGDGVSTVNENLGISLNSAPYKHGFMEVEELPNGGYLVVGSVKDRRLEDNLLGISLSGNQPVIVKYAENGKVEWTKIYPKYDSSAFYDIAINDDGSYYVVGAVESDYSIGSKDEILGISLSAPGFPILIKLNANNEYEWQKKYNNTKGAFKSVDVINGSDFVAAGSLGTLYVNDFFQRVGTALILKNNYKYEITKEKTENGSFEVSEYNYKATISVKADKGYIVDTIKVVDSNKKEVEVTKNEDGTYSYHIYDDTWVTVTFREYTITKLKTKNGEFSTSKDLDKGGITIKPNDGYELGKIIVKDSKGKEVKVTKNEDGTYSFELNDDVTVEVIYNEIPKNPKTGVEDYLILLGIILLICGGAYYLVNKKNILKKI